MQHDMGTKNYCINCLIGSFCTTHLHNRTVQQFLPFFFLFFIFIIICLLWNLYFQLIRKIIIASFRGKEQWKVVTDLVNFGIQKILTNNLIDLTPFFPFKLLLNKNKIYILYSNTFFYAKYYKF